MDIRLTFTELEALYYSAKNYKILADAPSSEMSGDQVFILKGQTPASRGGFQSVRVTLIISVST